MFEDQKVRLVREVWSLSNLRFIAIFKISKFDTNPVFRAVELHH